MKSYTIYLIVILMGLISYCDCPEEKVVTNDNTIIVTETDTVEVDSEAPVLASIVPDQAGIGDTIVLSGRNLNEVITVEINEVEGNIIESFEDRISVEVSPGSSTGKIAMIFSDTTVLTAFNYRIVEMVPVLSELDPDQGFPGDTISIIGENLSLINTVDINTTEAQIIDPENDTLLTFIVPVNATSGLIGYSFNNTDKKSTLFFEIREKEAASVEILNILPISNPASGPVLILGENLKNVTEISFGNINAQIKIKGDTFLTTNVPVGVDLGNLELVVKDAGSNDSKIFQVLNDFPNEPPSPPEIEIGQEPPEDYIPPITADWHNEHDDVNHYIMLETDQEGESEGTIEGKEEWSDKLGNFWSNDLTGSFKNGNVVLTIDRGAFGVETYEGKLDGTKKRMILYSKTTGRQLVIF